MLSKKTSKHSSKHSNASPSMKFGIKGMKGKKPRKDTFQEEAEKLVPVPEPPRDMKSVIKEEPEQGNAITTNYIDLKDSGDEEYSMVKS